MAFDKKKQCRFYQIQDKKMKHLNLDIGPITLGLEFKNERIVKHFEDYFKSKSSIKKPDIIIRIQFTDIGNFSEVPNSLFLTKKITKDGFIAGKGLIKGKFNPKKNQWTLKVHSLIVDGDYTRVFEQILYQAYTSAANSFNTTLVHSSGVIKNGWAYLFVGPSEAGKSTVARLSQQYQVINDEINIVNLCTEIPTLEGTPFNGLYRDKTMGKAPLKGIFILNKASFHGVEKISGGKAIKPLTKEIIPPIGLEEELQSSTYIDMMDAARNISGCIPIYRLDFLPNSGFWDIISKL